MNDDVAGVRDVLEAHLHGVSDGTITLPRNSVLRMVRQLDRALSESASSDAAERSTPGGGG